MNTLAHALASALAFVLMALASSLAQAARSGLEHLPNEAQGWLIQEIAREYPSAAAQVQMGVLDPRLKLAPCASLRFFLPGGARLWGNGTVGVKCDKPQPWLLYLTYQATLTGPALTARSPLGARHLLGQTDLIVANVKYEQDPGSYILSLPKGASTQRPMNAGQAVVISDLLLPDLVQAGARVWVRVNGVGYSVGQEGKALNSAKAGGTVQVKMPNGRIVRGTVSPSGDIEIRP